MAENLFLRLSERELEGEFSSHFEWMLLDETSGIVRFRGEGSQEEFRGLVADLDISGRTIVMIHGEDVLLTDAVVPSKQQRQILQAVPFMVEEQLATDVETCHFAIGSRSATGAVNVAVIDRDLMSHWWKLLQDVGVEPNHFTVDLLAVPHSASCSIFVDGNRSMIRSGHNQGVCIATDMLATTVGLLASDAIESTEIIISHAQIDALSLQFDQMNAESESPTQIVELEYSAFESLCRGFDKNVINLLQGDFKVADQQIRRSGAWRSVAILAGCAFLLHLFVVMGQAVYLDMQARQMDTEARALYAEIYPNDRNVRDMRRRWQNHLRSGGGATGEFMTLFIETTKNIPGASLVLSNVNYNESRGDLVLQLEASRSEQLISFADTLNKIGLEAEIGTINQADDAVRGSVKVKMLGGS
ncbi:MAG: general secretion pathway protein L [Candidatus Azotimanducaceae bacterium]|jgi:general secretion pathway protein L